MGPHRLVVKRSASRELQALQTSTGRRVAAAIEALIANPHPRMSVKLKGTTDRYRIRVGDYRVLYQIDDAARTVLVYIVRHRRDAYRP